jgi:DNA-binding transcriptional regulator GbsR (MarR family)
VKEADKFLEKQWPEVPPIRMTQEEYLSLVKKAMKNIKQPSDVEIEEINQRIEEQYRMVEDLQRWLDKYLKN